MVQMFQTNGKTFPKNYLSTSGVDLAVKVVNIPDTDTAVELYIHDCAGSELHRHMMPSVVRADARCLIVAHISSRFTRASVSCRAKISSQWVGCAAIILAYDMTNADSFKSCAKWMEMATEAFGGRKIKGIPTLRECTQSPDIDMSHFITCVFDYAVWPLAGVLLGCKGDMQDAIAVTTRAAQDFAAEHGLQHFECSAVCFGVDQQSPVLVSV